MSNLLIFNPTSSDDGLDYIFGKMMAIYGQSFVRNWQDIDPSLMRQVWTEELGEYLKSKEILDHALKSMDGDFPPSAIKFRQLCKSSQDIYDLETRGGVDKLAKRLGLETWDEIKHWPQYKNWVIKEAELRGVL